MAHDGKIDATSLRMYKNNLRFAIERFSRFEIDLLYFLKVKGLRKGTPFPRYFELLIKRLLDARYVKLERLEPAFKYFSDILSPDVLVITKAGLDFVESITNEDIGY